MATPVGNHSIMHCKPLSIEYVMHVNPCRVVKLRETSMLVHLQIISAESDKITESKLKLLHIRRAL